MKKYLVIITVISLLIGCGRVGGENEKIKISGESSSKEGEIEIIRESQFIINRSVSTQVGYYSLIFKDLSLKGSDVEGVLYENGSSSGTDESDLDFVQGKNTVTNNMLLLLDYSGSIVNGADIRNTLFESASYLVDNIKNKVQMAVYYFDGREDITPIIPERLSGNRLKDKLDELKDTIPYGDKSTNLNGAIMKATDIACDWLGGCVDHSEYEKNVGVNFEFSTIVIITDGRDQARWEDDDTMKNFIKNKQEESGFLRYQVIALDNNNNVDRNIVEEISSDKAIYYSDISVETIENSFKDLADWANSFYEVKYCPAARKGTIDIKIEVKDSVSGIQKQDIIDKDVELYDSKNFTCELP